MAPEGRRAKLTIAVVAVALAGVGCGSLAGPGHPPDPTKAAAFSRPAVERPGRLTQAQASDDLLVVSPRPLPKQLVDRIRAIRIDHTRGVSTSELFSLNEFTVENHVLRLAAVDPAGFRRFAGNQSALFQGQWDRIADGEIAVRDTLRGRLPIDHGYLSVGTGDQSHAIQVGAYSPGQVGTIDAVVNSAWVPRLGMTPDNALVISTGFAAPQAVRARIRELAPRLSITALDIVAATGIDPGTTQSVAFVGSFADAVGAFDYQPLGGGRVAPDPAWVKAHIVTEDVPILGPVTCNKYLVPQLTAALTEIQSSGLADQIHPDEYAGCYCPRFIAGTTTLSNHAFGLALDLNVPGNQRGTVGEMDPAVVAIFKRWGFAWGGDWHYTDPMHFELERVVSPS